MILSGKSLRIAHHSKLDALLPSLKIKGKANEDAVLCTRDKTFAMKSVVLSNSVLVVTSPPDTSSAEFSVDSDVVIRDQVNEIIELTLSVPKLHKLAILLRGREYDDGQAGNTVPDNEAVRPPIYIVANVFKRLSC